MIGQIPTPGVRTSGFVLIFMASLAGPVDAQTMYRCGKQYQDRPCDAGQPSRAVGNANPSAVAAANLPRECADRGRDSMRISWARESGVTLEKALAANTDARLVRDVYDKRGSAAEVRTALEADCQAEKEKEAKAVAALKALGIEGSTPSPAAGVRQSNAALGGSAKEATSERDRDEQAAQELKAKECRRLTSELQLIESNQRTGGSMTRMESLRADERKAKQRLTEAGC
jgi:hypothetical protein